MVQTDRARCILICPYGSIWIHRVTSFHRIRSDYHKLRSYFNLIFLGRLIFRIRMKLSTSLRIRGFVKNSSATEWIGSNFNQPKHNVLCIIWYNSPLISVREHKKNILKVLASNLLSYTIIIVQSKIFIHFHFDFIYFIPIVNSMYEIYITYSIPIYDYLCCISKDPQWKLLPRRQGRLQ